MLADICMKYSTKYCWQHFWQKMSSESVKVIDTYINTVDILMYLLMQGWCGIELLEQTLIDKIDFILKMYIIFSISVMGVTWFMSCQLIPPSSWLVSSFGRLFQKWSLIALYNEDFSLRKKFLRLYFLNTHIHNIVKSTPGWKLIPQVINKIIL